MTEEMRNLVSIQMVDSVAHAPDSDNLDVVRVGGWKVVTTRGEFKPGQLAAYIETDAALPISDARFAFLATRGTKIYNGHTVHVLRTARIRGNYSQGLLLPLSALTEVEVNAENMAEAMNIEKWEPPVDPGTNAVGVFPSSIVPTTSLKRVQNLKKDWSELYAHKAGWFATEKVDGEATTVWVDAESNVRVFSSRLEYLLSDDKGRTNLVRSMEFDKNLPPGTIVQGEFFGEGLCSNRLGLKDQHFRAFRMFATWLDRESSDDLSEYKLATWGEWPSWLASLRVPVLPLTLPETVDGAVAQVDGMRSEIAPERLAEGVVWHAADSHKFDSLGFRSSFKVISNKYLLKHGM